MDTAALWIASGTRYVKQAERSARRVAEVMPGLRRVLATDGYPVLQGAFDRVLDMPPRDRGQFWFRTSCQWFNLGVGEIKEPRIIYFDTDTYLCRPVDDLLALVPKFDLVGTHAPGRRTTATVQDVPPAFPELNVGVMVLRNNERVKGLLELWRYYSEASTSYGNNDQGPLRDALWKLVPELRLYIAPPEYNLRWHFGGFARYPVRVLHGPAKDEAEYQQVQKAVDWVDDLRGWARGAI